MQRRNLLLVTVVAFLCSVAVSFVYTPSANAITEIDAKGCRDRWDQKSFDRDEWDQSCNVVCTLEEPRGAGSVVAGTSGKYSATCNKRFLSDERRAAANQQATGYSDALQDEFCTMENPRDKRECDQIWDTNVNDCIIGTFRVNVRDLPISSRPQANIGVAASCLSDKTNQNQVAIRTAMQKVKDEVEGAASEAENSAIANAKSQEECRAAGGEWDETEKTCSDGEEEAERTCNIDGVGWIICPVMMFLAEMNDLAFGFIADNFLEIDATDLRDSGEDGLESAWRMFRNIANVAFVIVFLIIIYSQMVGGTGGRGSS